MNAQDLINCISQDDKIQKSLYKNFHPRVGGWNKNLRYFLWTLGLFLFLGVFVTASGVLNDNYLQLPTANFSQLVYLFGGANMNGSNLDNVGQINTTNIIANNLTSEDGDLEIESNLTIYDKITFALGGIISNLNGMFNFDKLVNASQGINTPNITSPTGNLLTDNLTIEDANITGDLYSNTIHPVALEGLILGYNFNLNNFDATNSYILDSSSRNYHANLVNGSIIEEGGFNGGGVIKFSGLDAEDYLDIPNIHNSLNDRFTVFMWVNVTEYVDSEYDIPFACDDSGESPGRIRLFAYHGMQLGVDNVTGSSATLDLFPSHASTQATANQWKNYAFTYDGSTINAYVDGVLVDTDSTVSGNINLTATCRIGRSPSHYPQKALNGSIDNLMIFNRSLSSNEIKNLVLQNYEVGNSYISQKDLRFDIDGNAETNLTFIEGNGLCLNSTCGSFIYDNGTDLIIQKT